MKYYLTADIGGTNPRLAMLDENRYIVEIKDLTHNNLIEQINDFLKYCGDKNITTDSFCIAAAGPIENNKVKLTNAKLTINKNEILEKTLLSDVYLINDFVAIGSGVNNSQSLKTIRKGTIKSDIKLVIGPGTGLGCCLVTNKGIFPSESYYLEIDFDFAKDIKHVGEIVSGPGISKLYEILYSKKVKPKIAIKDKKVQELFSIALAKFVRNMFFTYLPTGGIYFAGGVLQKNPQLLGKTFQKELSNYFKPAMKKMLKEVPLYLIQDYNISLHGGLDYIKKQNQP